LIIISSKKKQCLRIGVSTEKHEGENASFDNCTMWISCLYHR
jgi:hypothetical protein